MVTNIIIGRGHLDRKYLGKEPRAIPESLWNRLRSEDPIDINTCSEHREYLFASRQSVDLQEDTFSKQMIHLLRACIQSDPHTEDKDLTVVEGGSLRMDSYYDSDEKIWKLDRKLFDLDILQYRLYFNPEKFKVPHGEQNDSVLIWDGPIVRAYSIMLDDLDEADLGCSTREELEKSKVVLQGLMADRLLSIPRAIQVDQTGKIGELQVFWESAECMAVCK